VESVEGGEARRKIDRMDKDNKIRTLWWVEGINKPSLYNGPDPKDIRMVINREKRRIKSWDDGVVVECEERDTWIQIRRV
jgi:hypothetical protein